MRLPPRMMAGAVLGIGMAILLDVGPVSACSCSPIAAEDILDYGLVAEGTVTSVTKVPPGSCSDETKAGLIERIKEACPAGFENCLYPDGLMDEFRACGWGHYLAEFELETVWKGRASGQVQFHFDTDDGLCGMTLGVGDRLTILSESPAGDIWHLNRCNTWAGFISESDGGVAPYQQVLEQYRARLTALTGATIDNPESGHAWTDLAKHLESGDSTGALHAYERAILVSPDLALGYLGIANLYITHDRLEEAREILLRGKGAAKESSRVEALLLQVDFLLGRKVDVSRIDFRGIVALRPVNLSGLDLRGVDFSEARFSKVTFDGAKLDGAKFRFTELTSASFTNASLDGADFTGANLLAVSFRNVSAHRAIFVESALSFESDFSGASLDGANFHNASLGTSFQNTSLKGADLSFSRSLSLDDFIYIGPNQFDRADLSDARLAGRTFRIDPRSGVTLETLRKARTEGMKLICFEPRNSWFDQNPVAENEKIWLQLRTEFRNVAIYIRDHPKVLVDDRCRKAIDLVASFSASCRPWADPAGEVPLCALPE